MAPAPGHQLGQIIGQTFELAVEPPLAGFCRKHDLYLDGKRPRRARTVVNVRWEDDLGNTHDLDHVIERGGTEDERGIPVAFIETAWRRYTKHSKAKAQEMQAAVLPVLAKWSHVKPFGGVMLAGEFARNSLQQLRSNGFVVLHIPYQTIIDAFATFDIDVYYDAETPDADLRTQIDKYHALSTAEKQAIGQALREAAFDEIRGFIDSLQTTIVRRIDSVSILPLHGSITSVSSVRAAITLLRDYASPTQPGALVRFEVVVRYDNSDRIVADFANAADAIMFLETFD
ncbi:MAG: DNA methylase [Solirubrobacteraceae bacterium]